MSEARRSAKQLGTLERLAECELDQARAEHVAMQTREQEARAAADGVRDYIAQAQEFGRTRGGIDQSLSPDLLRQIAYYTSVQQAALQQAEAALEQAKSEAEAARVELMSKARALFSVERLGERRDDEAVLEASRQQQRLLDDYAVLRVTLSQQSTSGE